MTADPSTPLEATEFEAEGARLAAAVVPWDTEILGVTVADVTAIDVPEGSDGDGVFAAFEAWCGEHDVRLAVCRLDHARLRESMALEDHGFRFIEMVHSPRLTDLTTIEPPRHAVRISAATAADLASIEAIAGTAFTTGRFVLDWRLDPASSRRRYETWVRNSAASRAQRVLKAEVDGELVGFFIVERRPGGDVYWHLTAIEPRWQGEGIGLSVWRAMLQRHREEGATAVETTISGHNEAALNLYGRLGFRMGTARMTFHRVREPG